MTQVINESSQVIVHITMKLADGSAADSTKVNNKPAKIIMGDQSISPAFEAEPVNRKNSPCSRQMHLGIKTLIIFIMLILISLIMKHPLK